ncbi:hypothetical protein Acsp01_05530 [Actinoplanes sp. NBRC 101535]|nr:hypothetical protein Acsp01_05530 [Actinoplanes sp. NBRC 101535]
MAVAEVPESKRYCAKCNEPVGRARGDRPGRGTGFCPSCGEAFDFTPKLAKGDLVGGQYEVVGPLAHGGLGWIYLAVDKNVSDRWVVLKGLLNSGDEDALAAAVAERRFLAEVEHPNIVKIYNFVEHTAASGDTAGYIVMEYVGGKSLKDLLKQHGGPLPVDRALAYLLEIMPAFGYLHDRGLIYCDFKPDNVIQAGDQMRLIDLGGVVHEEDEDSAIYGTIGYQAPEIAVDGPSIASDLYTIGRTLAVLTTDFRGYQSTFRDSLPDRGSFDAYKQHESFYRLIVRATRPDPADRFVDAAEMSEQMLGVLRQVLAAGGEPRPAPSRLFTAELRTDPDSDAPRWQDLPTPLTDLTDPSAAFLASVTVSEPSEVLTLLTKAPHHTLEVRLRELRAYIDLGAHDGSFDDARAARALLAESAGDDWRVAWYDGLLALAAGDATHARERFEAVWAALPGELAPQLALGLAAELAGDAAGACRHYDVVSRTDPAYTTAAAGLARCRLADGDRSGAVEAYNRVPGTSSAYRSSQVGAVRALIGRQPADRVDVLSLSTAADLIDRLEIGSAQLAALRAELLEQALTILGRGSRVPRAVLGTTGSPGTTGSLAGAGAGAGAGTGVGVGVGVGAGTGVGVGARTGVGAASATTPAGAAGTPAGDAAERDVRFALEAAYREMARAAHGPEKIRLVDLANAARPRTRT